MRHFLRPLSREESDAFDHPNIPTGHPLRRHVLYRLRREEIESPSDRG
jgi:hypothetical protein